MRSDRGFLQQVASGHRVTIDFSFDHRVTDDFKVWSQGHGGFWPVTNCDPGRSRHYSVNGSDRPLSHDPASCSDSSSLRTDHKFADRVVNPYRYSTTSG